MVKKDLICGLFVKSLLTMEANKESIAKAIA